MRVERKIPRGQRVTATSGAPSAEDRGLGTGGLDPEKGRSLPGQRVWGTISGDGQQGPAPAGAACDPPSSSGLPRAPRATSPAAARRTPGFTPPPTREADAHPSLRKLTRFRNSPLLLSGPPAAAAYISQKASGPARRLVAPSP